MCAHPGKPGLGPTFELEPTDHPLSQEYHHGMDPLRIKEILMARVPLCG